MFDFEVDQVYLLAFDQLIDQLENADWSPPPPNDSSAMDMSQTANSRNADDKADDDESCNFPSYYNCS